MALSTEINAKDIATQFRSIVEAENIALLGDDESTFAEQDFFTQLGWFTDQIEAQLGLKKSIPSPDVLALIAALGGAIVKRKPKDCIEDAYETWNAADKKIREEALCSREEIKENLSQVGWEFRRTPWPVNEDGAERKNLDLTPFLRLIIPLSDTDSLEKYFKRFLRDNPLGEKRRTSAQVEKELKKIKEQRFVPKDHREKSPAIIGWWMKQKEFKPLDFPKGSFGYLVRTACGFPQKKRSKKGQSNSNQSKGNSPIGGGESAK
jgi:hypothetical protein